MACVILGASHLLSTILSWNLAFRFECGITEDKIWVVCCSGDPAEENGQHQVDELSPPWTPDEWFN